MAKLNELILVGGGGHCRACIDVIEAEGKFKIVGIVDVKEKLYKKIFDYEIISTDSDVPKLMKTQKNFLITIGQVKTAQKRFEQFEYLKKLKAVFPVIISPFTTVSKYATIDEGTIVMHDVCVNAGARIGKNCIINSKAIVEHDVVLGNHCHISTGAIVNGGCAIGNEVFVGSNAVVVNNVRITDKVIIGAGSVVIKSITEPGIYVGNPVQQKWIVEKKKKK